MTLGFMGNRTGAGSVLGRVSLIGHWVRSRWVTAACLLFAIGGCAETESIGHNDAKPAKVLVEPVALANAEVAPDESSESVGADPESTITFDEDANFFALPSVAPVRQQVSSAQPIAHDTVRFIGLIDLGTADSRGKRALLKIGKRLMQISVGEEALGIKVIAIEERSVTLQRGRDRWTLAMLSQPIVNKPVASKPLGSRIRASQVYDAAGPSAVVDPASMSEPPEEAVAEIEIPAADQTLPDPVVPQEPNLEVDIDLGIDLPSPDALPGIAPGS